MKDGGPRDERLLELAAALAALELEPLEEARFLADLGRVRKRLETRQYRLTGFDENLLNIPDRAQSFFTELDFHAAIGRSWAALLAGSGATRSPVILDLGPGWIPKVELGLFYLGYRGEVVVADKDPDSIGSLNRFLALFLPTFHLRAATADVLAVALDPQPVVVGNHVIDDLILDAFISEWGVAPAELYRKEGVLAEAWRRILKEKDRCVGELGPRIAAVLDGLVSPGGGLLILTQYQSYVERVLGLPEVTELCDHVLREIKGGLSRFGFAEDEGEAMRLLAGSDGYLAPQHCHVLRRPSAAARAE